MPTATDVQTNESAGRRVTMEPHRTLRHVPLAPHELIQEITHQSDLFVLAHMGVPRINVDNWTLTVTGLVRESTTFTFDKIRQFPKREVQAFHQCAGFPKRPQLPTRRIGNVVWGGVDLKTILESVGVLPAARFLWSFGHDYGEYDGIHSGPYVKDLPLDRLSHGDVLLAYEINGDPLDALHGYPLRLLVPGYYGTNSVKWLSRLELADRRADGPFTTLFYNDPIRPSPNNPNVGTRPVWQVAPESLIVSPAPDAKIGRGPVEIWGRAWADGGVASVDVSTDGGQTWHAAELGNQTDWSWQTFRMRWDPWGTGNAILMSRATDKMGAFQPDADWRNAVHAVRVTKTDL
jgi:sulfane dehydrogenase subunit SoxC